MNPDNFRSKNLNLPFIAPAQAQKHVSVNEAFRALDALVQLSVLARDIVAPPESPVNGASYIVPNAATDAWASKGGQVAAWQDGAWAYYAPQPGWRVWCAAEQALLAYDNNAWTIIAGAGAHENLAGLGIGTVPDMVNRLAVVSPAALFTHAGGDQRIIVNKASTSDTASLLYQSNYSGRAEMGASGDDDFRLKVSPDGSAWHDALTVDRHTGFCRIERPAFDANLSTTQTGVVANIATKLNFDSAPLNKGGFFDTATGRFTPPEGLYALSVMAHYGAAEDNMRAAALIWKNGVEVKSYYRAAAGTDNASVAVSGMFYANGTDYFEAAINILGSGTKIVYSPAQYTHFQGYAV